MMTLHSLSPLSSCLIVHPDTHPSRCFSLKHHHSQYHQYQSDLSDLRAKHDLEMRNREHVLRSAFERQQLVTNPNLSLIFP